MSHNGSKPYYSSTEGEDTSGSDSDEVSYSDSGEKQQQEANKTLIVPLKSSNKPQAPDPSSSEAAESGSDTDIGSGSDSDSPPKSLAVVDPNVKPISSIPTEPSVKRNDPKLVKKVGSKTISTPSLAKSKRPPAALATIEKDAKKAKQNSVNVEPKEALISPSKSANKRQFPDISDEETGSETDTNLPPKKSNAVNFNIKPISSVPMESKSVKKPGSKTTPTASPAKRKPSASGKVANKANNTYTSASGKVANKANNTYTSASRMVANTANNTYTSASGMVANTANNTYTAPDDSSKKQLFQRMFSEDDEIGILKGMIDYKVEKNGESHIADIGEFHEFIKKSLHVDVSNAQLADKVRRLKKKYVNNASRKKDGIDPSFSKTHEQKAYELSKLIWGSNSHNSETESKKNQSRKNVNSKVNAAGTSTGTGNAASVLTANGMDDKQKSKIEVEKKIDVSLFVPYGGLNGSLILPEEIVKAGMELVDGSRRAELEVKWKELKEQELVVYVKRLELLKEQALVVLEAIRSSGN